MNYYIKELPSKRFEVLDLYGNCKLEGTEANVKAAFSKALFHAYSTYGVIEVGRDIVPPTKTVNVSYKKGFLDIKTIQYTYGCHYHLTKLKVKDVEPDLQPTQLSLFKKEA